MPEFLRTGEIITFNQHFPRARMIRLAGGTLNHYVDAPFAALVSGRGLDLKLPAATADKAAALERENFAFSKRVITMARWAADVIINECKVPSTKVFTILPGSNLDLPANWQHLDLEGRAGRDRDFVLGFVGKDWKRKGLPIVMEIRDSLERRGWRAVVHAAGGIPAGLEPRSGVHFAGFINKKTDPERFVEFIARCDLGCLFSDCEALGISTLEFLRAGVPVAGFAHEGPADTIPPDAGFRFESGSTAEEIADVLDAYLRDEAQQNLMRRNAQKWSALVTWERCVREFEELWETGAVKNPVRLWRGLHSFKPAISSCPSQRHGAR